MKILFSIIGSILLLGSGFYFFTKPNGFNLPKPQVVEVVKSNKLEAYIAALKDAKGVASDVFLILPTGSMHPVIGGEGYDAVDKTIPFENLQSGMVIVYKIVDSKGNVTNIIHMCYDKFKNRWIVTGVHNEVSDYKEVTKDMYIGVVKTVYTWPERESNQQYAKRNGIVWKE